MLNHDFVLAQARHLAERLAREVPDDETARIQHAYQLLFGRPATSEEITVAQQILKQSDSPSAAGSWQDLAHVLLCCNEFVYLE